MALDPTSLKEKMIVELKNKGFVVDGEFAKSVDLAEAFANAIIAEFIENGIVVVTKGSSAGDYKIT